MKDKGLFFFVFFLEVDREFRELIGVTDKQRWLNEKAEVSKYRMFMKKQVLCFTKTGGFEVSSESIYCPSGLGQP